MLTGITDEPITHARYDAFFQSHLAATFNALLPHRAITASFRRSARCRILLLTLGYNTSVGSRFFLSRRDIRKNEPNGHKKYSEQEWYRSHDNPRDLIAVET